MLSTKDIAEDIADDLLFRTGHALLSDNEADFAECFWIPVVIETIEGLTHIGSYAELKSVYRNVFQNLQANGVTNLARSVVSAQFLENDIIGSTHVAQRLSADGKPVGKPYPVYSTLKQKNSEWRIESCLYAVLSDPLLNKALSDKYQTVL